MFSIDNTHDEFGPTTFNINNILESIPRSRSSEYRHVEIKSLILDNMANGTYSVHSNTNIQAVNKKKADEIIRKYIWNNFFGLNRSYTYSEAAHYPSVFELYLKTRIGIDISSLNSVTQNTKSAVDGFTLLVRNVIFTKILYLFKSNFIETVNTLINGQPIIIHNDSMFEIKKQWKHWLL